MHRNPLPAIKHLLSYVRDEKESRRMFDIFRARLPLSRTILSRRELSNIESDYDAFIAGSDQIWNPENSAINPMDCDRAYLLDFVRNKPKYAYAASIGKRSVDPPDLLREFVKLWELFTTITMREHVGAEYVGNSIGRRVETVVDPVLLHDSTFWRNVASPVGQVGGYVLLYNIKRSSGLKEMAHKVARDRGVPVIDLLIPAQADNCKGNTTAAGPAEFLSYIEGADCVFTGSFHASAFSVIFGKKLYVQCPMRAGNANSRIETLFSWAQLPSEVQCETTDERILFCDCRQKDEESLNREINRSREILMRMVE